MKKLDLYILTRLFLITFFVLLMLICTYIIFDFSNISDTLSDRGVPVTQAWNDYYIHFIPEIFRLVSPLALLIACIYLTGRMSERLEIVAIKAAGISLNRLVVPYLLFALALAGIVSYMDAYVNPLSNTRTILFEEEYLPDRSVSLDRGAQFRLDSGNTIFDVSYFDIDDYFAYRPRIVEMGDGEINRIVKANRIEWVDSLQTWQLQNMVERTFTDSGYVERRAGLSLYDLNLLPQDLSRSSSDIYQLTYPQAAEYINSIRRLGAGNINLPMVQFYGRVFYPISIIVVSLIGFSIASVRRKGGRGFYIAAGFGFSFIYLTFMKVIEPFGATGQIDPVGAAAIPHLTFLLAGIILLLTIRK